MVFGSEAEAEEAYRAYAEEAGCSRMNAAFFIEQAIPSTYPRAIIEGGANTGNTGITVADIAAFYRKDVQPEYIIACLAAGAKLNRIMKLWEDGIPPEYVDAVIAA